MLADTAAAAVLAPAAPPAMLADATAAAVLALLLRCRLCSQMLLPPQSLHVLRCRLCSQMCAAAAAAVLALPLAALLAVLADAFAAAVFAHAALPPVRTGHNGTQKGQNTLKYRDKSESAPPRAARVDPGHSPSEVSPDPRLALG